MNQELKKKLETALQLGDKKYYEGFDTSVYGNSLEAGSMPADGLYEHWMQTYKPELVIEVVASEITLSPIHKAARNEIRKDTGLALRFPKFTG